MPVGLLALLPLLAVRQLVRPVDDPDIFWHLRMGAYVLAEHTVRGPDPFSSFADQPLVLHEWPLEVVFTGVERVAGFAGLVVLQALLPVLLLLALHGLARRVAPPLVAAPVAVLAWIGTSGTFALRPQLVSFALLALALGAWLATARDDRARWWLVPLTWVWAALHGLWVTGPAVGGLVLLGMLLDDPARWRRLLRPALVLLASVAVAGLTPLGPSLILKPFTQASAYAGFVTEWTTPTLTDPFSLATVGLLVVAVVGWARHWVRPTWPELLLWLAALGAALLYARTVAVGAVIVVPLAARALASRLPEREPLLRRREVGVLAAGAVALLVVASLLAPRVTGHEAPYPTRLDAALDALPAGTRVLNTYEVGGWLLWRHVGLSPYADGRTDPYSPAHLRRYADLVAARPGWAEHLREDRVQAVLVGSGTPLVRALSTDPGWRTVGSDAGYTLLVPAG